MMIDALEDLTFDVEDDGVLVRKQLDRAVLTQGGGGWATVMFLYQELDPASGRFRPPRMAIVRFRKVRGAYRKQSSFTLSNAEQAGQLAAVLARWSPKMDTEMATEDEVPPHDDHGESAGGADAAPVED